MKQVNFDNFIGIKDIMAIPDLIENLIEPRFTLKDFQDKGINSRTLFHWNKENLVWRYQITSEDRSWNRFSFLEFIWLKIVIILRDYGISFKIIKNFKESITAAEPLKRMIKSLPNIDSLVSLIPDEIKDDFLNWINSDEENNESLSQSIGVTNFLILIAAEIMNRENIQILVNNKGEYMPYVFAKHKELIEQEEYKEFLMNSYFSISLYEVLKDFVSAKNRLEISGKLEILSPREVQIIDVIRNSKNLKSVKIRFGPNNEMDLIEQTTVQKLSTESRLMEIIMKNGYQNIEITTENGKIIKCLNTKKIKAERTE